LKSRLVLGVDVTPENLLAMIGRLEVGPNDAIVILYSGHGEMQLGNHHVLTFRHGYLTRIRLLEAVNAKRARLAVLLTDCCSAGIPGRAVVPEYEPKDMPGGDVMEWNTVSALFLHHSGLVDITAAEPGFYGKVDAQKPGSYFTNALVRILKTPYAELVRQLDRDGDGQLQWDEALPQLRGLAARYDRARLIEINHGDLRPQQAYATSLGCWTPLPDTIR
jgi:hypothetical protein